jgi:hypothetical protein
VFYASWDRATAAVEINARAGDIVQFVACRPRPGILHPFTAVGVFESVIGTGRLFYDAPRLVELATKHIDSKERSQAECLHYLDAFLASQFRSAGESVYALTSAIAQPFLNARPASAMIYPSVRLATGVNIAVSDEVFDTCWEVVWTAVAEIRCVYRFGICDYAFTRFSNQFAPTGDILWARPMWRSDS